MPPRTSKLAVAARALIVPYVVALGLIVWLPGEQAGRLTGIALRLARSIAYRLDLSLTSTYAVFEFLANIALFVPFGLLLAMALPRINGWLIILMGYASSATIELVQTLLPSRYPTLSDVVANTLGTVIGCLVVRLLVRTKPAPRIYAGHPTLVA